MLEMSNVQWQFVKYINGRIINAPLYRCKFNQWSVMISFALCVLGYGKISFKVRGVRDHKHQQ